MTELVLSHLSTDDDNVNADAAQLIMERAYDGEQNND
jgi:hypothetical protein